MRNSLKILSYLLTQTLDSVLKVYSEQFWRQQTTVGDLRAEVLDLPWKETRLGPQRKVIAERGCGQFTR